MASNPADNFPKSLYYVYVRLARPAELPNLNAGRYVLTCASRYHADEFFRTNQRSVGLQRLSAQMWTYNVGGEAGLHSIMKNEQVPFDVKAPVLISWIQNGDIRIAFTVTPPLAGRDWISGQTYFIRNIRQPDVYWYWPGGSSPVLASQKRKTRFHVRCLNVVPGAEQGPVYLVRSDAIRISAQGPGGPGEMILKRVGGSKLACVASDSIQVGGDQEFTFGDLLGSFGTGWESSEDMEHITWADRRSQMYLDDWELC